MNAVKTNLKRLRTARKMTQDELAEKLHVVRQTVSSWETGKTTPDVETLTAISEALDADITELIYGGRPVDAFDAIRSKRIKRAVILIGITSILALLSVFWMDILSLFHITSGYNPDFTHNLRNRIAILFGSVYLSSLAYLLGGIAAIAVIRTWKDFALPRKIHRILFLLFGLTPLVYYWFVTTVMLMDIAFLYLTGEPLLDTAYHSLFWFMRHHYIFFPCGLLIGLGLASKVSLAPSDEGAVSEAD